MANPDRSRLAPRPGEAIDRASKVEFELDGRRVRGFEGDTVASALSASGTVVFSRSFKYHRPRGLLCAAGNCPNCLMTVDGEPNVRSCVRPIKSGMKVKHQNAWPSLGFDLLSVLDRLHWLMPVGFYYKALHRPKALWLLARRVIRRVGGLGSIDIGATSHKHNQHHNRHADVAVVGGGPAGMEAALAAAGQGSSVTLIDEQTELGGHLRSDRQAVSVADYPSQPGYELGQAMAAAVRESPDIEVMNNATVFGLYQDNLLGIMADDTLVRLRAGKVVLATGAAETPLLFEDNDLPGIMLGSAARRLMALFGVRPGNRAIIATDNVSGYEAALELVDAGVTVAAVADSGTPDPGADAVRSVRERGVRILEGYRIVKALGRGRVKGAVVGPVNGGSASGAERIRCDLICMSGQAGSVDALLHQGGGALPANQTGGWPVAFGLPEGLFTAGDVNGPVDLETALSQGRSAGTAAVTSGSDAAPTHVVSNYASRPVNSSEAEAAGGRSFVCFCEDVSAHDVVRAIEEGFEDVQTLKRYTTVSMGPCQGKMCGKKLTEICAQRTGFSAAEIGLTTGRPPFRPVPLSVLAGPSHMPVKRSPLDGVHRQLGAVMVDSGPWQRPHNYGDPAAECAAVRERVGIIDVSTLGKLDVRGPDAAALLDRIYTHHFSDLRTGRIRYGLMCSDNGVILDDGTVTRLAEDRYFVTTTSGNSDLIEEWFNWWNAGAERCAHVFNVTSAYGAVNIAGPRAREMLSKLTDLDLTPSKFRYMRSAEAEVAGVPCLLLRIGFVGETGWEVHFPAEDAEYLWGAFMEAGAEFGIAPFGLEAQRVLRLEKGHIIVGQDTDAVSNPLDAGSEWVVRFDKDDFIGRGGLAVARDRGSDQRLVGFIMQDGVVPQDGVPVVSQGRPVGRVTSSRLSPTLGRGFGLAWLPPNLALEGADIEIVADGRNVPAKVTLQAVYDPEGERLRS